MGDKSTSINDKVKYIRTAVSCRSQLEMLAEECSELAQACLKCVRLENEDAYPLNEHKYTAWQVKQNLYDEMMDVVTSIIILLENKETAKEEILQNEREIDQRLAKMCDRIRRFDV
jgi:NTP pyrophosphatase (non-canonical NTP hydrolase)